MPLSRRGRSGGGGRIVGPRLGVVLVVLLLVRFPSLKQFIVRSSDHDEHARQLVSAPPALPCDHRDLPMVDVIVSAAPERHFLLPGLLRMFDSFRYPKCRIRLTVVGDGPPADPELLALFGGNRVYVPVACEEPEREDVSLGCYPNVTFNVPWAGAFFNWRNDCRRKSMTNEVGVGFQCKTQMAMAVLHGAHQDDWEVILTMDSDDYYPPGYVEGLALGLRRDGCDVANPRYQYDVEFDFEGRPSEPTAKYQGKMMGHSMALNASSLERAFRRGCRVDTWHWDDKLHKCMAAQKQSVCFVELDEGDWMNKNGWNSNTWRQVFQKDNDAGGINGRNQTVEQYAMHLRNLADSILDRVAKNGTLSADDMDSDRRIIQRLIEAEAKGRVLDRYQRR